MSSYTNSYFRGVAKISLVALIFQVISPIISISHAVNVQYYVDATNGNDANPGTSTGAPWQTLARVNAEVLQPDDHVSLLCGESWAGEVLDMQESGNVNFPIVFDSYSGGTCSAKPVIGGATIGTVSHAEIEGLFLLGSGGPTINIGATTSNVSIKNSDIAHGGGNGCIEALNSNGLALSGNTFSLCSYAFSGTEVEGALSHNTFSGMTEDAIQIVSTQALTVQNNTFNNLDKGAVVFGVITSVLQNEINNSCRSGAPGCAAIRNEQYSPLGSLYNATISENIIKNIGSGITMNNYGILISNVDTVLVSANTVNNAEEALHIEDAKNLNIINNTLALSRARGVHVIQNATGAVSGNTFQNNSIIEKNPDYPYIEMRDNVVGGTLTSLLSPTGNKFFPLYKPNTSYVRAVKYGGNTLEYGRRNLSDFDTTIDRFDLFGYRAYTNTGTPTGGELLGNGTFSTDASLWSSSALTGSAPTLSYLASGSHLGGSLQVIPTPGAPDRIWLTNDSVIPLITGRYYHITGYLKSGSGNINIGAFLHSVSDKNTLYSDRIAETYASATGGTFSLYLQANTGASDARLTIESSNSDVSYEIDEVSMIRVNSLTKNNTANEIHVLSNTGSSDLSQACPGGTCGSYIDITSVPTSWPSLVSWPITIPAHRTSIVVFSGGSNIIYPPTINSFVPTSGGSVDAGSPATVEWDITNGLVHSLHYLTYDNPGGVTMNANSTGNLTFVLPYNPDLSYDAILSSENDAGIASSTITFSVNNTPPLTFVSTITGSEDSGTIYGTLSGYDITPGDFNGFSIVTPPLPTEGALNLTDAMSGTIDFTPEPEVCGTVYFDFSASDFRGASSSPQSQPIQIACTNDAPVLLSNKTASGFAGIPFAIDIIQDTNFEDIDSLYQSQTFSLNFTQPTNGSVTSSGTQFQYTSNPVFSGADSFQFSVSDQSGGLSATGTVNVMITRFNNLPTATSSGYMINEDSILSDTLTGSDADGDILSYTALTLPANGIVSIAPGGNFTYTPNTNYNGSDSFVFRLSDGMATSTGLITLTISSLPDSPVAVADSISVTQDTSLLISVMTNDSDPDGSVLTLTGFTSVTSNGGVVVPVGTGFLYTPFTGYIGPDSFMYMLEDDTGLLSNIVSVSINVTSSNSAPTSLNVSASTNEDTTLIAPLSASDPDLDTLTYILDTGVSNGSLTLFATGGFRYIPVANYSGIDTFTYHVSDGSLTSTASTVTITVIPVNDTPTGVTATYAVTQNTASSSGHVFTGVVTGSDIDGNPLTFTSSTVPVNGTFTLSSTGYFTYTPALEYSGTDSFSFLVNDGIASSTATSVNLVVGGIVVVTPPPATGPGGGGGGGSSAPIVPNPTVTAITSITTTPKDPVKTPVKTEITDTEEDLSSAPESKPFEFVLYDPTGLLSQLLLANRIMGSTGGIITNTEKSEARKIVEETFGSIVDSFIGDFEGPFVLRNLLQVFVLRADASLDTVAVYDEAIENVEAWQFSDNSRLDRTKKYILRILERNRKHYEELLYRTTLARFEEELSSATEEIENIEGF